MHDALRSAAADAARLSVMPIEREGGQAQFIVYDHAPTPQGSVLEALLTWLQENLARDLTLAGIAERAGTSTRTLIRRFRDQTGTTPLQWLHRARIRSPGDVEPVGSSRSPCPAAGVSRWAKSSSLHLNRVRDGDAHQG